MILSHSCLFTKMNVSNMMKCTVGHVHPLKSQIYNLCSLISVCWAFCTGQGSKASQDSKDQALRL